MRFEEFENRIKDFATRFVDVLFNRYTSKKKVDSGDIPFKKRSLLLFKKLSNHFGFIRLESFFEKAIVKCEEIKTHVLIRYICRELLVYFIVLFLVFFAVFFVNQFLLLIEILLRKHVSFFTALRLIVYYMPAIIAQSAPFATLVGFLMCLGRFVTDNEILILRASGLRYSMIFVPVLLMGLFISIFSFVMNDYFLPVGNIKAQELYKQIASSNPAVELEPNSVKRMNSTIIVVGDVDKTNVSDIVLFDKDGEKDRIIVARDSDVKKVDAEGVLMQMQMNDATVIFLDHSHKYNYDVLKSDAMTLNIFDNVVDFGMTSGNSPSTMTSFDLGKHLQNLKKSGMASKFSLNSYRLEFSKKFSIPFASIFFALLAFPLSLVFGKRDGQVLGLVFGLVISVLYWAMTIMGQMFGVRSGMNGYLVTWFPNVLVGLFGVVFYLRLRRK